MKLPVKPLAKKFGGPEEPLNAYHYFFLDQEGSMKTKQAIKEWDSCDQGKYEAKAAKSLKYWEEAMAQWQTSPEYAQFQAALEKYEETYARYLEKKALWQEYSALKPKKIPESAVLLFIQRTVAGKKKDSRMERRLQFQYKSMEVNQRNSWESEYEQLKSDYEAQEAVFQNSEVYHQYHAMTSAQ